MLAEERGVVEPRMVYLEWEDASVEDGPWVDRNRPEPEPIIFRQLGFLMKLTASEVVLTGCLGKEQMSPRDRIPAGMVRKLVLVREGTPIAIPKKRKR